MINRIYSINKETEFEKMFLNFIDDDFSTVDKLTLKSEKQLMNSRLNAVNYFKQKYY